MAAQDIDPFDVGALERSLNDSATRVSTLWISFLVFGLYLIIAAGTVSKLQLLLQEPVRLPVLNIDLPLVGFFALAPVLFVVFHAYLLIQVLLLGRTAAAYNEAIDASIKAPLANARLRQRLANTLFTQLFAGSPRERTGWLGALLTAMAWFSLAIAPTFVLLVFQFTFLPFHNEYVTWEHRLLILIELVVVFLVWPLALDPRRELDWRVLYRKWYAWAAGGLFIVCSLWLLSFPGEIHIGRFSADQDYGRPALCTRFPSWLASIDRLDLPRVDVVDDEKLAKIEKSTAERGLRPYEGERTRNFRGRDLNCSNFSNGDLRRVDLTGAHAIRANWFDADLRGASLDSLIGRGMDLVDARLQEASLRDAKLDGAMLAGARLSGALAIAVHLRGARLDRTDLRGSDLRSAQLDGSVLFQSDFRGALLTFAALSCTVITGADFRGAQLSVASLRGATLQGSARLDGANLQGAQLQAATFDDVTLGDAKLDEAVLWKTQVKGCRGALAEALVFTDHIRHPPSIDTEATEGNVRQFLAACRRNDVPHSSSVDAILSRDAKALNQTWQACIATPDVVPPGKADESLIATVAGVVCTYEKSDARAVENIVELWIRPGFEFIHGELEAREARGFKAKLARRLLNEKRCLGLALLSKPLLEELRLAAAE